MLLQEAHQRGLARADVAVDRDAQRHLSKTRFGGMLPIWHGFPLPEPPRRLVHETDEDGESAMHVAARQGRCEAIGLLAKRGASANAINGRG